MVFFTIKLIVKSALLKKAISRIFSKHAYPISLMTVIPLIAPLEQSRDVPRAARLDEAAALESLIRYYQW